MRRPFLDPDCHSRWTTQKGAAHSGSTTWAFLYTFGGNRREKWLKSYEAMSIEQARDEAVRLRNLIRDGRDPLEEEGRKATPKRLNTFEAVAERAVASFVEGMTNAKAKDQWMSALRTYAFPLIRSKDVSAITTED